MLIDEQLDLENEALKGLKDMGVDIEGLNQTEISYAIYLMRTLITVKFNKNIQGK